MDGQGFQFRLGGMQPLGQTDGGLVPAGEVIPHAAPIAASESLPTAPVATPTVAAQRKPAKASTMSPGGVVRAARERIREIKAELKLHTKLKRELAELERLVKAAKEKPSNVRSLKRVS